MSLLRKLGLSAPAAPAPKPPINALLGRGRIGVAEEVVIAEPRSRWGKKPVEPSWDLSRVIALPRRALDITNPPRAAFDHLKLHPASCRCAEFKRMCPIELLPIQAWALYEAMTNEGLLGPIGVGHGKTLLDMLTPMVMPNCRTAVLLLPPNLRTQFVEVDWKFYGQHWKLPNLAGGNRFGYKFITGRPTLHVVAFSELSTARATDLLARLQPDLIVIDEAHHLKDPGASRTSRYMAYLDENPTVRVCAWSGTLTSRSIRDYAHHAEYALGEGSPLPMLNSTLEEWAGALDPSDWPSPIGALRKLCNEGEEIRTAFRRRLVETPGVVATTEGSIGTSLVFDARSPAVPKDVVEKIRAIRAEKQRPDGEELVTPLDVARCAREMACGFFYRWRWPRGEPLEVRERWKLARKMWHRELRDRLQRPAPHLDSPLLLARAAIRWYSGGCPECDRLPNKPHARGCTKAPELPLWDAECWPEWFEVRDTAKPETETVWVSDFLVEDAAQWGRKNVGIIWYEHDAFGRAVAERGKFPLYGAGSEASATIIAEKVVPSWRRCARTARGRTSSHSFAISWRTRPRTPSCGSRPSDAHTVRGRLRTRCWSPCTGTPRTCETRWTRRVIERCTSSARWARHRNCFTARISFRR
jgi:hypothetical protein